jgi:hypothetical protein
VSAVLGFPIPNCVLNNLSLKQVNNKWPAGKLVYRNWSDLFQAFKIKVDPETCDVKVDVMVLYSIEFRLIKV